MVTNKRYITAFILSAAASAILVLFSIYLFITSDFTHLGYNNTFTLIQIVLPIPIYIGFSVFFIVKEKRPILILSIGLMIMFLVDLFYALYYIGVLDFIYTGEPGMQNNYMSSISINRYQIITLFLPLSLLLLTSLSFTIFSFGKKFKTPTIIFLILNIGVTIYLFFYTIPFTFSYTENYISVAYNILFYASLLAFTVTFKKIITKEQQYPNYPVEYIYDIY